MFITANTVPLLRDDTSGILGRSLPGALLCLSVAAMSLGVGCNGSGEQCPVKHKEHTNDVLLLIEAIPPWSEIGHEAAAKSRLQTVTILQRISKYDLETIREAEGQFISKQRTLPTGYDVAAMSKLYVLNKYLFALPEEARIDSARFFGGWLGVPHDSDDVNLLWPFSKSEPDRLSLTGTFGGYNGDDYLALEAFDYYRRTFGRRAIGVDDK